MEIYLIRHTMPSVNAGTCYGRTDMSLADSFSKEWTQLKKKLPSFFDIVYTSPLKRCFNLARRIKTRKLIKNADLMELDFGEWEMKSWDDIEPKALQRWSDDFVNRKAPGGESFSDLKKRTDRFWKSLPAKEDLRIAVVSHAGVIRTILAAFLGMPLKNAFSIDIDYGSIALITVFDKVRKVKYINHK